jgi:RHS repeat-associated protein
VRKARAKEYDFNNRVIRTTDADSVKTRFDYDGQGRLVAVVLAETDPLQNTTTYGYDELGQQISQTDALSRVTRFAYDALGRRISRKLPGDAPPLVNRTENWEYDYQAAADPNPPAGKKQNKIRHVDFGSRQSFTTFDNRGRLANKKDINGATLLNIEYNQIGKRWRVTDTFTAPIGRFVEYEYDNFNRLAVKKQPFSLSVTAQITYGYYADGNIHSILTDQGTSLKYFYDGRGRLWKVNPWENTVTHASEAEATYKYDAAGNLRSVLYKNGIETRYAYNRRNQLRRVRTGTAANWDNSAVAALANFDYDEAGSAPIAAAGGDPGTRRLSLSGQRNRMAERLNGNLRTVDYDYDKLKRLTSETIGSAYIRYTGNVGTGGTLPGYDAVGNRRSRISTVSGVSQTTVQNGVFFDKNDQIDADSDPATLSSRFDENGNTMVPDFNGNGLIDAADTGYYYAYNLDNQLITANGGGKNITLNYDADGNRVRKDVSGTGASTTYYLVDDQNPTGYAQVLEERSAPDATPTVIYTYGLDLVNQDRGGNVHYFGYDGLGSVRYLTHSGGGISDTYTYDAFGIQTASISPTVNHYRFAGEQWDSDLQMYYLRARYYAPGLGRFWAMDTYEGSQNDPLSLHKYLYCHGNPVNGIDPSGHTAITMDLLFGSSSSMNIRTGVEANRAPLYKGTLLAALTISGAYAASEAIESIQIQEAEMTLAEAGTSVKKEISKAAQILRTRVGNIRPKIVPIPISVLPAVAQNVAVGQLTTPGPLQRAPIIRAVLNRYYATRGRGSAGLGMSWDEYPFASSNQGGNPAVVRPVPAQENRVQGGIIAAAYTIERINVGDWFTVVITP